MEYQFSDRVKNLTGNAIREIFKLVSQPDVISFAGGLPATECLPADEIKQLSKECIEEDPVGVLQYGATEGYLPLRNTMLEFIKRSGIENQKIDNTLIISGGQQGIDLFVKCFLNKGEVLLVQTPTYLAVLHISKTYEVKTVGVGTNDEGLDLIDLENKIKEYNPKAVYLVPNFSNPTGKTLSVETRKKALEICEKYGVLIVEDDPYRELRYSGENLPSIKSFDKNGNVIYICSMSKTIAPALRVGVAVAPEEIIRKMTIGKQATDVHTNSLAQAIVSKYILKGMVDPQLKKAIPIYREKRDAMLAAIEKYMPKTFKYTHPDGGLFIWGEFTDGTNAAEKFKEALAVKVAYVCGKDFFADGKGENCIRLNFSNATIEQIETGIKRLGAVFSK